jgi:multiple sugar transport system substrate-binding protein
MAAKVMPPHRVMTARRKAMSRPRQKTLNRRDFGKLALTGSVALGSYAGQAAAADVTLSFPSWQVDEPGFGQWWREVVAQFESETPGVKIKMEQIPAQQYSQEMLIRCSSGQYPDIVYLRTGEFGSFASQGWLAPLDDRFAATPLSKEWTGLQSEVSWGGKPLGIVIMGYGFVLFYNEAILKRANVLPPTTLDDFTAGVRKVTDRPSGIFGLASSTKEASSIYLEMISFVRWQQADLFANGRYTLTSPASLKAFEAYRHLIGENAPLGNDQMMARQIFKDGKAGFLIDGPWVWAILAASATPQNFKIMAMPFRPKSGGAANSLHIPIGISRERQDLVWRFYQVVMRPEWQRRYLLLTASPPGLTSSLREEDKVSAPHLIAAVESARDATPFIPQTDAIKAQASEFIAIMARGAVRIISTQVPISTIAAETQSQLIRAIPVSG